jgi:hypothetical protein
LHDEPSDAEISTLCNDPNVKEYMKLHSVLCKPVYIITGLKIAKKFALKSEHRSEDAGEMAPEASAGGKMEASKGKKTSDQGRDERSRVRINKCISSRGFVLQALASYR